MAESTGTSDVFLGALESSPDLRLGGGFRIFVYESTDLTV
jgi:hypothetical protein